jgi:hypothetical protein
MEKEEKDCVKKNLNVAKRTQYLAGKLEDFLLDTILLTLALEFSSTNY